MKTNAGLALLLLLPGCGGDDATTPPACADYGFVGDPEGTPELEVGWVDAAGVYVPLDADGESPELRAPTGSEILIVEPRIHDLDGCSARITARLRDPNGAGEPVVAQDVRSVDFDPDPARDGWGVSSGADEGPTLSVCPNSAGRDLDGCEWILQVDVEDAGGRTAQRRVLIVPVCPADDALCECKCAADFDSRDCGDVTPWWDPPAPACGG